MSEQSENLGEKSEERKKPVDRSEKYIAGVTLDASSIEMLSHILERYPVVERADMARKLFKVGLHLVYHMGFDAANLLINEHTKKGKS